MKRGDTLIEVILAFSVFSAVMMGGLWLMNSAMARAQGTLQLTMARNAMDGQAEMLRFLNGREISAKINGRNDAIWSEVLGMSKTEVSKLSICPDGSSVAFPDRAFFIDPTTAKVQREASNFRPADTYPRLVYEKEAVFGDTNEIQNVDTYGDRVKESRGIWIEAVRQNSDSDFVDFHIRACWVAPGQATPTTLGTIVRLYVSN